MNSAVQLYTILVLAGLLLLGAEIYLPGGVIGFVGALALLAAIMVGFIAFPHPYGMISAVSIIVLMGVVIWAWVKYFPRTAVGRHLTLQKDGRAFKAPPEELKALVGQEGTALTILRPSGMAEIGLRRYDVIAEGTWIAKGQAVRVMRVEGVRVIVQGIGNPATNGTA